MDSLSILALCFFVVASPLATALLVIPRIVRAEIDAIARERAESQRVAIETDLNAAKRRA